MNNVSETPSCYLDPSPTQETTFDTLKSKNKPSKYFHEIGAEMQGNQLIIRVEKDRNKKKKESQWEPICDCEMVEIKRPTKKEGPKIVNAGDNNQILFRIHSKNHLNTKDDPNYKPQAIAYKVGPKSGGQNDNNNCKIITVHPQMGDGGTQELFSDHVTEGNQDIFLLKIKKKDDSNNQTKRNIELELRTPKPPTPLPPAPAPSPLPEKEQFPPKEEKVEKELTKEAKQKPKKKGKRRKKKK